MAASFWNNPLFGGGRQQQYGPGGFIDGKLSKCNNMAELLGGVEHDLGKILELGPRENDKQGNKEENEKDEKSNALLQEHSNGLAARLARIKRLLYEEAVSNSPESDAGEKSSKMAESLAQAIASQPTLMPKLLRNFASPSMPFESRKDIAAIFANLMVRRFNCDSSDFNNPFAQYVMAYYNNILTPIVSGHGKGSDIALLCGAMLRSTLCHHALYKQLLSTSGPIPTPAQRYLYPLLDTYVHLPNFDVASDVLATIQEILGKDKAIAAEYLEIDYDNLFSRYNVTLQSKNYITRRLSLKLLGEILLDRSNFNVMMKYISSTTNLQIVMLLLSDPSPNIQFEAFHIFKIFVANPTKPDKITKILKENQEKLIRYLEKFHVEREEEDEQFREEKGLIISTLNGLE